MTKFVPESSLVKTRDCNFVQLRATYVDNAVMRLLFHVTAVEVQRFEVELPYEWMSREQINLIDHPSTRILQGLIDYTSGIENSSSTPIIAG